MSGYMFRLFIRGRSPSTEQAIVNVYNAIEEELDGNCELEIIDLLERPEIDDGEAILATPTLVKVHPLPSRRVVGDMADTEALILGLGLELILHPEAL